jgi:YD repeat-containing protein
VNIAGTPFTLHYQSDRTPGYENNYSLNIPVSGANVPAPLKRIELSVTVAGRTTKQSFAAAPNQTHTFTWDGLDAFQRSLTGRQPAAVRIDYMYDGIYNLPPNAAASFGLPSGIRVPGDIPARQDVSLSQEYVASAGAWSNHSAGLGLWSLSIHHAYDPVGKVLYLGNGQQRSADSINNVVTTVAGNGTYAYSGDGGPATNAALRGLYGIAVDANGNLYISDRENSRIRRVARPLPGISWDEIVIPSQDGTEVFVFSGAGLHLRTLNALTGAVKFQFVYDSSGKLVQVTDGDNNVTTIERDGSGNPTAIVSPFGQAHYLKC